MLTLSASRKLFDQVVQQEQNLGHHYFSSPLARIEARYTLFRLNKIFREVEHEKVHQPLIRFLADRWDCIQNTDYQYTHDIQNPANILCCAIAKALANENNPYLVLLMPTLRTIPVSDYIVCSYEEDEVELSNCILSDDNQRLIDIMSVLDFAKEDGHFRQNSLKEGTVIYLSPNELNRMMSKSNAVKYAMEMIQERICFMHFGNTAGAALKRLIDGLRAGGSFAEGTEHDAGQNANIAIIQFRDYLKELDRRTKKMVLNAGIFDRFRQESPELKTVRKSWALLCRPKQTNYMSSNFCVELIADNLCEILDKNPGLYDLVNYKDGSLELFSNKTKQALEARQSATLALKNFIGCASYPEQGEPILFSQMMLGFKRHKIFHLTPEETVYIIERTMEFYTNDPTSKEALSGKAFLQIHQRTNTKYYNNLPQEFLTYIHSQTQLRSSLFDPRAKKHRSEDDSLKRENAFSL